jgi:peroxiredoxin
MKNPKIRGGQRFGRLDLRPSQIFGAIFPVLCAGLTALLLAGCKPSGREELLFKSDERYLPMVGKPSPPLKFKALDGREVDLEQLRGKVVLLDFWATWCPPCLEELPHVRDAYGRYKAQGLEIIGVSFDADRARLEEVVKRENITWPQYFDGGGRDAAPGKVFGIRHWPSMWLLDRNGVVRFISAGAGLDRKVGQLLAEPANAVTSARGALDKKAELDKSGDAPAPGTKPSATAKAATPTSSGGKTNLPSATATATNAPVPAPAARVPDTKLGDHPISVKSISITAKKSTALLQIGQATYTVSPGMELQFTAAGAQRKARCTEVTRDEVVLAVEGTEGSLRLRLP